jgi:hypothetical protein
MWCGPSPAATLKFRLPRLEQAVLHEHASAAVGATAPSTQDLAGRVSGFWPRRPKREFRFPQKTAAYFAILIGPRVRGTRGYSPRTTTPPGYPCDQRTRPPATWRRPSRVTEDSSRPAPRCFGRGSRRHVRRRDRDQSLSYACVMRPDARDRSACDARAAVPPR